MKLNQHGFKNYIYTLITHVVSKRTLDCRSDVTGESLGLRRQSAAFSSDASRGKNNPSWHRSPAVLRRSHQSLHQACCTSTDCMERSFQGTSLLEVLRPLASRLKQPRVLMREADTDRKCQAFMYCSMLKAAFKTTVYTVGMYCN